MKSNNANRVYRCLQIQVQSQQEIVCSDCGKKYKTQGGFKRHRTMKHGNSNDEQQLKTLNSRILHEIVDTAILKVKENMVYSTEIREELNSYRFELEEGTAEFTEIKTLYDGFLKHGNVEKFYTQFYAKIPLNSTRFFRGLSQKSATLLSTKVAVCMLSYNKKGAVESKEHPSVVLSDKEKSGLEYLGGYVFHNLHKKHSQSKSNESSEAMAILKAGKSETCCKKQKLISSLNRGGLWSITTPAHKVLLKTEHYFREHTSQTGLQQIDFAGIVKKSITDSDILSNYQLILCDAELVPRSSVSKNVLRCIIELYVRVRSFSFAKDIVQKYKIKKKQNKVKSLRKELSKSCEENGQERHE